MNQRYLILVLLVASMIVMPAPTVSTSAIHTTYFFDLTMIETQLQMEIAGNEEQGTRALLEFDDQLSASEIMEIECTGLEFVKRGSTVVHVGRIYSAIVHDVYSLQQLTNVGLIRATSGAKQYVPSLDTSVAEIRADDVWSNLEVNNQDIDGTGVTVAVIDTGATWLHPSFWKQYPAEFNFISSGPDYYVDLNDNAIADANEGPIRAASGDPITFQFDYTDDYMFISTDGTGDFDYADGDRWIGGIEGDGDNFIDLITDKAVILNISKVAILYDQFASNVYIRDVNLTQAVSVLDSHSTNHGTHVASTIAGGQPGLTSYIGVAPGADLIIIRCPLSSSDILDGISFAIENDADVINMSFSSYLGFLDGTDPEDIALTEAFLNHGILSTAAAGNLGGHSKHARFSVPSGGETTAILEIDGLRDWLNPYLSVLWQSDDRDEHLILTPPTGEPIDLGEFSSIAGTAFALENDHLSAYVFCEISPRGMNNIIIQISAEGHFWENGLWDVSVSNPTGDDFWVDSYSWDGDWDLSDMQFQSYTDNLHTISSPATSDFAIAVASYSEGSGTITSGSSKGPRIDGAPKPNIAAPGQYIKAAWGGFLSSNRLWETKTGTSMASPHIAGALALISQAQGSENPWMIYSALVNGAGNLATHYDLPVYDWGHGLCDVGASVMYVLNETLEMGSTVSDWALLETLASDADEPDILPDLDLRYVKMFQQSDVVGFAVWTDASSDFSGTDMLSLEWDSDSNILTGTNGADILVNLTSDTLSIYEWNGSFYELSSCTGSFWSSSTNTFLKIEGLPFGVRGDIVLSTHNASMSYVDTMASTSITNNWRPMTEDVEMSMSDDNLTIIIDSYDGDSSTSSRSIGASIVYGNLSILQTSLVLAEDSYELTIDADLVRSQYVNSLSFNITSEMDTFYSPFAMLTISATDLVRITGATLDSSVVRKGILFSERISGQFSIVGYELISEAQIGFRYSLGLWFNFTVAGDGLYEFIITPAGFPAGQYEVYAMAKGVTIPPVEMQFATLTIIEDNTLIVVGIGAGVAAVVAIFTFRRYSYSKGVE